VFARKLTPKFTWLLLDSRQEPGVSPARAGPVTFREPAMALTPLVL